MDTRKAINWLLVLLLLIAPLRENLADALEGAHDHTGSIVGAHVEVDHATHYAGTSVHDDHGAGPQIGHNHDLCGAQCFAALICSYALTVQIHEVPRPISHPRMAGFIMPPDIKPPRYYPL